MALSASFRFSSASIVRFRHCNPCAHYPSVLLSLCDTGSKVRFLSSVRPRRATRFTRVRRRDADGAPAMKEAGEGKEERNDGAGVGNGSLAVKDRRVVTTELHKEATESYLAYAMSVLVGRALPDVRDGLKPVHRRILFAMHELGFSSRRPFKKCARVVGEVLGKYHPHGDTAVYDSLVRMAQDFSMRWPLVQGHGNFGSIDADPPAAMRYTECRLEALTEAVFLSDLEEDTVDFVLNFDESQREPSLLPARVPSLLLNGSSGIAVGMATNIPPHNLGELVDALSILIHNPEATLQELLEYMPGPDFPTGGKIMGNAGILQAYRTGRGSVILRGKTDIELVEEKAKRNAIIITEIPYQINKASLIVKIAELVESKMLEGISDIRDESDRSGMRIVIELKRSSDPAVVLNNLYRFTSLQSSFSCNMVGILDGQPKLMGLKELLQAFLDFRCSVVQRRAKFRLAQAQEREHVIEGIIVGIENLDAIIRTIKETQDNKAASTALQNDFNLTQKQAEALLDTTLEALSFEREKFVDERKSLKEQIRKLTELLSSRKSILQLVEQEANEVKNKFKTPRRSVLEDAEGSQLEEIDVILNEEIILALSEKGYVKRMKPSTFNLQNRGTIGKSVGKMRVNDLMSDFLVCRTHDHVLFSACWFSKWAELMFSLMLTCFYGLNSINVFSSLTFRRAEGIDDRGIVYSYRAYRIPECSQTAAGTPLVQILSLSEGERITSIIPVSEFAEDQYLVMLTANGFIKKTSLNFFSAIRSTGIIAIQLVPGDELKWVRCCTNDDIVAMASQGGMVLLSSCNSLRALSRNTRGVVSMKLKDSDSMACMDIIPASMQKDLHRERKDAGPWLLFISEGGYGKRVSLSKFRLSPLRRVGLVGYKLNPVDHIAAVFVVGYSLSDDGESDEQVVLVSKSGTVNRIKVRDVSIQSRFARGVILMRLELAGKIQSASLISATDHDAEFEE